MGRSITFEILDRIAANKGVEPADLDLVLEDHIDTEALEKLADHETASWTLSFQIPDHVVTISNDGTVSVDSLLYESVPQASA